MHSRPCLEWGVTATGVLLGEWGKAKEEAKDSGEEGGEEDGETDHEANAKVLPGSTSQ